MAYLTSETVTEGFDVFSSLLHSSRLSSLGRSFDFNCLDFGIETDLQLQVLNQGGVDL